MSFFRISCLAVSALGSLLTACVPAYTAPASGPAANLELQMFGGADYRAAIYASPASCSGRQSLGLLGAKAATRVTAEQPLSLLMESEGAVRDRGDSRVVGECNLILTFTPHKDAAYVVEYRHSEAQSSCGAKIFERVMENGSLSKVQIAARQRVRLEGATAKGAECRAE